MLFQRTKNVEHGWVPRTGVGTSKRLSRTWLAGRREKCLGTFADGACFGVVGSSRERTGAA